MTNLHPATQVVLVSLLQECAPPYLAEQLLDQPETLLPEELLNDDKLLQTVQAELTAVLTGPKAA